MRIRLKKGVALIGTIAGAAIATALIVYNVNHGNSLNVSNVEDSGLLDDIDDVFDVTPDPTVVADVDSADAAAAAGILGNMLREDAAKADTQTNTEETVTVQSGENAQDTESETSAEGTEAASAQPEENRASAQVQADGASSQAETEVQTYVEAVPQTHTETRVSEREVTVQVPVTVTEVVSEEVEAEDGDFHIQSGSAAAGELTTNRRAQEAQAAYEADQARLKAAAKAAEAAGEQDYKTGDDLTDSSSGDSFIIFY